MIRTIFYYIYLGVKSYQIQVHQSVMVSNSFSEKNQNFNSLEMIYFITNFIIKVALINMLTFLHVLQLMCYAEP